MSPSISFPSLATTLVLVLVVTATPTFASIFKLVIIILSLEEMMIIIIHNFNMLLIGGAVMNLKIIRVN